MNIKELQGKEIKISKNSITAKGENGKTCGIVRNVSKLMDLPPRKVFEFAKKIDNNFRSEVCICEDEIVVFNNLSTLVNLARLPELYAEQEKKMIERKEKAEKFATVIDVYL